VEEAMSIQKKSLISTLKTAKKANVASDTKGEKIASMRVPSMKTVSTKQVSAKTVGSTKASYKANFKSISAKSLKSAKSANLKATL
jgi:hypothetical protein